MYARDTALIATPIGAVRITGDEHRITSIRLEGGDAAPIAARSAAVARAAEQLTAWFAGERTGFDVSLAPAVTPRGGALRQGMVAIGYGETMSYGALARSIASSARAITVRRPSNGCSITSAATVKHDKGSQG
jgi:methylated-DNA-[protein]-cysteine S-methyltransferase